MSFLDMAAMLTIGGIAACAQIMWAHDTPNRLGEAALELAIVWVVLRTIAWPAITVWALRARRARLGRREAALETAETARLAAEERRQSILQVLSEPVGPEPIEAHEPQPVAQ